MLSKLERRLSRTEDARSGTQQRDSLPIITHHVYVLARFYLGSVEKKFNPMLVSIMPSSNLGLILFLRLEEGFDSSLALRTHAS